MTLYRSKSDTISYKTYIVIEIVLILFKIYSTNKSSIIQISFFRGFADEKYTTAMKKKDHFSL